MTTLDRRSLLLGSTLPFIAGGGVQRGALALEPPGGSVPPELLRAEGNWPAAQGNLAGTRTAVGASLDAASLARMELAWSFAIEASTGYGGMTATPIIVDGVVYLQDMLSNVFALELTTGELIWERRYDVGCIGPNGLAIAYGWLFGALGDTAEVFALDASTGAEQWWIRLSHNPGEGIDMAPAVYDSVVYVSTVAGNTNSFNRAGTRGVLYAVDASSGEVRWQFDTTTDNLWGSPRINSGGGLWYPPSFDEGSIYFGVANAAPWPGSERFPNGESRAAPNDFASSAVALDRSTGAVRWAYNAAPHDLLDHDFQNTPVLVKTLIHSREMNLAICSGKTGTVVAVDRDGGEVVWKTEVGIHLGDDVLVLPDEAIEIWPGAWGGVLTPIAVDRDVAYIPVVNQPTKYSATAYDRSSMFDFANGTGELVAIDIRTGSIRWSTRFGSPQVAGATVSNDVVITAGMDGAIHYLARESGLILASHAARAGVNACPAVAGNHVVVAAAGPLIPSTGSGNVALSRAYSEALCFTFAAQ